MRLRKGAFFLSMIVVFLSLATFVYAMSDEESAFLRLYFTDEELQIVSTTRSLKSITRVAENVEVVTKEDIEVMNAHTLADVLNTVNGVVISFGGASPGSIANASIQGSAIDEVAVFIDGVRINVPDVADIASIPVQMIEKVEVIKGPASSAWGSSLGGVINVITKSPSKKEGIDGVFSASYGEKNTGDFRAEASGRKGDFGYYFYAGRLQTDGLRPFEDIWKDNLYTKFTYDLTRRTNIGLTFFYNKGRREEGDYSAYDVFVMDRTENLLTTLNLNSSLTEDLDLNVSLRAARERFDFDEDVLSSGLNLLTSDTDFRQYGASTKLTYKTGINTVVFGSDYDYREDLTNYLLEVPKLNVFAVYANDTISTGGFSFTPGIRYDYTDRSKDFLSPSLGLTVDLSKKTILRGYIARGFNLPNFGANEADSIYYRHNPDLKPEEVWSYQFGVESGELKYVWLKASGFWHDIRDAIIRQDIDANAGTWTAVNAEKVRRRGLEAEMRTVKFYNFSVEGAITYQESKDMTTGQDIHDWPDYTYDLGLKYDDEKSFRALLKGRYVWWSLSGNPTARSGILVDLNLVKSIIKKRRGDCELFFTAHNIFDSEQFWAEFYRNARRWVEAGVRYKF